MLAHVGNETQIKNPKVKLIFIYAFQILIMRPCKYIISLVEVNQAILTWSQSQNNVIIYFEQNNFRLFLFMCINN